MGAWSNGVEQDGLTPGWMAHLPARIGRTGRKKLVAANILTIRAMQCYNPRLLRHMIGADCSDLLRTMPSELVVEVRV